MPRLLVVHHTPSPTLQAVLEAVREGAALVEEVEVGRACPVGVVSRERGMKHQRDLVESRMPGNGHVRFGGGPGNGPGARLAPRSGQRL